MKVKTSELTGAALDWAVAKCEGKAPKIDCTSFKGAFIYRVYLGWSYAFSVNGSIVEYTPSTDWARGGPIIERTGICLEYSLIPDRWCACIMADQEVYGPTALIAAMRCLVADSMGDEVEIPEELA